MAATVQALQVKLFATCLKHAKTQSDIQEMSCVLKLYVYLGRQTDTMSNVINFEHPSCGVVNCSLSSFGQPKPICMGSAVDQLLQVHRLMKCQTVLCSQHNAMRQQLQLSTKVPRHALQLAQCHKLTAATAMPTEAPSSALQPSWWQTAALCVLARGRCSAHFMILTTKVEVEGFKSLSATVQQGGKVFRGGWMQCLTKPAAT